MIVCVRLAEFVIKLNGALVGALLPLNALSVFLAPFNFVELFISTALISAGWLIGWRGSVAAVRYMQTEVLQ